mmetsp:Transcript_24050/g.66710  ORF Transcript_24050/g.66710 Transcript_24050/m.66710 type:complete len:238 (+) Transcript_24050:131-844(+)|eukprot:CAMPEP_0168744204 /NCGR_PEP_ID=MMETSP0724-20121128/13969_1 /TAXON_ID=265536 /ORGANISM="Amphiprora sp., Strain CCMP467" /LENGTH=237 /DNA_ID=CAMNT_0008791853 /DNA_START=49 /DNA_END=762 /DNA_ORIENTATION=+
MSASTETYISMKPVIPEEIEINSPFYTIAAAVLTISYPLVVMMRLHGRTEKTWKGFIKGAQMGAICAFLVQDFFTSLLVAFHQHDGPITAMEDGTLEQRSSVVAYNPGTMSVVLPSVMLLTIPFIKSSVWLGVVSASMVQQCVRLLLVIFIKAPVEAADPGTSMLGVGDFFRTELLLGAAFVPIALFLIVRYYDKEQVKEDDEDEEDVSDFAVENDLELAVDEEGPSSKPLLDAAVH